MPIFKKVYQKTNNKKDAFSSNLLLFCPCHKLRTVLLDLDSDITTFPITITIEIEEYLLTFGGHITGLRSQFRAERTAQLSALAMLDQTQARLDSLAQSADPGEVTAAQSSLNQCYAQNRAAADSLYWLGSLIEGNEIWLEELTTM